MDVREVIETEIQARKLLAILANPAVESRVMALVGDEDPVEYVTEHGWCYTDEEGTRRGPYPSMALAKVARLLAKEFRDSGKQYEVVPKETTRPMPGMNTPACVGWICRCADYCGQIAVALVTADVPYRSGPVVWKSIEPLRPATAAELRAAGM